MINGKIQGPPPRVKEEEEGRDPPSGTAHHDGHRESGPASSSAPPPAAVVSSPGSDNSPGSYNAFKEDHATSETITAPGAEQAPPVPSIAKVSGGSTEDANILLMLKKTPESPPRNRSESTEGLDVAAPPSTTGVKEEGDDAPKGAIPV